MQQKITADYTQDEVVNLAVEIVKNRIYQSKDIIADPSSLKKYLVLRFAELGYEIFGAVFLDNSNRVIAMETLFRGTLGHTSVYPREVIKTALTYNAAAVIFYHNHPAGSVEPSPADISLTKRLGNALKLVDVQVLEHIIIAGANCFSFVESGRMPAFDLIA